MTSEAQRKARKLWIAHPDDAADVADAAESVERGELLSADASEAFVRWLEGSGDESWRVKSG